MSVVLRFSGSVVLDDETIMQSLKDGPPITIAEWVKLSDEEREDYILDNALDAIKNGVDLDWEQLDLYKEQEEV